MSLSFVYINLQFSISTRNLITGAALSRYLEELGGAMVRQSVNNDGSNQIETGLGG